MKRYVLLLAGLVAGLVVLAPGVASAHPLGNFTVNQYSGLVVTDSALRVDYAVDLAEIPTFQAKPRIDGNRDGKLSATEATGYAATECVRLAGGLRATADDRPLALRVDRSAGSVPPGQAGLPTLRLACTLSAALTADRPTAISYRDGNFAGRVGWREVSATGDRMTLTASDVPARSVSAALSAYPADLTSSPPDVRGASFAVRPGGPPLAGAASDPGNDSVLPRGVDRATTAFLGFVNRSDLGVGLGLVAVLLALGLGGLHALAPGHGKTVMAAYLVGRRGSLRTAATIGATVTVTHTAGVLVLGVALSVSTALAPERLFPILGLLSGLLLAVIGAGLLRSALRGGHGHRHGPHGHAPGPHGHGHGHAHGPDGSEHEHRHHDHAAHDHAAHDHPAHDHPAHYHPAHYHPAHDHPAHDHARAPHPAEPSVPRRRSLIAMGFAGGLVPSPSALVVLLGAIAFGRAWFGVVLVVTYGLGMAVTLTLAGLLLVRARTLLDRRSRRPGRITAVLSRALPIGTAGIITLVGLSLALRGATVVVG